MTAAETSPLPAPTILGTPECIWDAGANLGEGTMWSPREQALYWIDILTPRLFRFHPASGERRSWRFAEEITAIAVSGRIAETLRLAPGAPALSIVRRYHDEAGEIVILSLSIHPADRFVYAMNITKQGSSFAATI